MDVRKRRKKGSAIAEFGPALFLFIVIIFFPMLDMLGLLASYCMGYYCNFMACRELSVRKKHEAGDVLTDVNGALFTSGIVQFLGMKTHDDSPGGSAGSQDLAHNVTYINAVNGMQPMVQCTTFVRATPFISIPWWGSCPGLNAPMDFQIVSQRPSEVIQD